MPDDVELIVRVHVTDDLNIHAHNVREASAFFDIENWFVTLRLTFERQTHDLAGSSKGIDWSDDMTRFVVIELHRELEKNAKKKQQQAQIAPKNRNA